MHVDLSVVITMHSEGLLAYRTIKSVLSSVKSAEEAGASCEVIVVLDKATPETSRYVKSFESQGIRSLQTEFGDPSPARNFGVMHSKGAYVALVDGDDLFSKLWLKQVYQYFDDSALREPTVVVPLNTVVFDQQNILLTHPSSNEVSFNPMVFAGSNYWNSVILACHRELIIDNPFEATPRGSGFGYEDWHWLSKIISKGITVSTIPDSVAFSRRKISGSRLDFHVGNMYLMLPSPFFYPPRFSSIVHGYEKRPQQAPDRVRRVIVWFAEFVQFGLRAGKRLIIRIPLARRVLKPAISVVKKIFTSWTTRRMTPSLLSAWRDLNAIEPLLLPDFETLRNIQDYTPRLTPFGEAFANLCAHVSGPTSFVLLVPWLKRGGSDLETIYYACAIAQVRPSESILVIGTEKASSPWKHKLPEQATFVPFGDYATGLSNHDQCHLLATFLTQLKPQTIHILNSELGYGAVERYGSALRSTARIFASVFCEDYTDTGLITGYPVVQVPRVVSELAGVLADNSAVLRKVEEIFGIVGDKFFVHYQPVTARTKDRTLRNSASGQPLRILWAGRLDRQKRPDIALQVAKAALTLPVEFHFYGQRCLDNFISISEFKRHSNVTYHGGFDGIEALETERFDVLLSTSQWEGLPNMLLDALVEELPVIAANVGGVCEVIQHEVTGLLVSPFDSVDGYVSAIKWMLSDRNRMLLLARNGRVLVQNQHSHEQFINTLKKIPNYFPPEGNVTT